MNFVWLFFSTTCVCEIKIPTNFRMPFKGRHLRLTQIKQIIQHTNTNSATHWRYKIRMFLKKFFSFFLRNFLWQKSKRTSISLVCFSNLYEFIFNTLLMAWCVTLSENVYYACGRAFRAITQTFLILSNEHFLLNWKEYTAVLLKIFMTDTQRPLINGGSCESLSCYFFSCNLILCLHLVIMLFVCIPSWMKETKTYRAFKIS